MKLITLGDSITRGTYSASLNPLEWKIADPNYSESLKRLLNADELLCLGVNGVSVSSTSKTNPEYALTRLCESGTDADIFVIAGGTNDYGTAVELGNETDKEDVSFYGGLYVLYTRVKALNPKAKIFAVLPIPRQNEARKNPSGYSLEDYRAAIEKRAAEFDIAVIDGRKLPIDPESEEGREKYILDGLHPTQEGHDLYAKFLYKEITKKWKE